MLLSDKITKIEIQRRKKDRVNVYINEEYSFACSVDLVFSFSLFKGKNVDTESLKKIIEEDNYISCKNYALNVIEKNYKTEKQMLDKLVKKEYSEKVINRVFLFLKEYSFVDDNKYTDLYIREKISKQGKIRIKYDLLKKGIEPKLIDRKLEEINITLEKISIEILAKKKYDSIIKTEGNYLKIYNKLKNYLFRLGYTSDMVNESLKSLVKYNNEQNEEGKASVNEKKVGDLAELKVLAKKRYDIIMKRETEEIKIYKRLWDYLIRRGYKSDEVKKQIREVMKKD